ncbi:MAG TPA: hypothetical protein VKX17_09160 [Planctomycetota bacterium]|nr:hypothetical protein [Planctomycetota bacterium]
MSIFFIEWGYVLAALCALALAGWFLLQPFRVGRSFIGLAAPGAGICALSLCMAIGYFADFSLKKNIALSFGGCAAFSLWFIVRDAISGKRAAWRTWLAPALAVLIVSAVSVLVMEEATLRAQGPALQFMNGTDALGYAHVSDWLQAHRSSQPPALDAKRPFESWIWTGLMSDSRFGVDCILATLSRARKLSGMFTFDFACAVLFSAGLLAFAAGFARSRNGLLLAFAGAALCCWFDQSRAGFFGKLAAYPSLAFLAALLLEGDKRHPYRPFALAVLTLGACLLHTGLSAAMFLFIACSGLFAQFLFEAARCLATRKRGERDCAGLSSAVHELFELVFVLGLCAVSWFFLTKGVLGVPSRFEGVPWWDAICGSFDICYLKMPLSNPLIDAWFAAALGVQLALAGFALRKGLFKAAGLLGGSVLFVIAALLLDQRYAVFQSAGTFYPFALGGAVWLYEQSNASQPRWHRRTIAALALLLIAARIPRVIDSARTWLGPGVPAVSRYSKNTLDAIQRIVAGKSVELQLQDVYRAEAIMVELGGRGVQMQYDAVTWRTLFGYRGWPQPPSEKPSEFILTLPDAPPPAGMKLVFENQQYKLFAFGAGALNAEPDDVLDGLAGSHGLHTIEGPYPQWGLPKVRWGIGTETQLRITDERGGAMKLLIRGRGRYDGQSISVEIDGAAIAKCALPDAREFADFALPLQLAPGPHFLTLRYARHENNPDKPCAVLFSSLRVVRAE